MNILFTSAGVVVKSDEFFSVISPAASGVAELLREDHLLLFAPSMP
jgi:hypothetical protein